MTRNQQTKFLRALQNPVLYDHPVSEFELIETHISWVLLTGDYAYKIKKPVDLGFVDFSTLEKRRHYCQEELRLNQRLAPMLYLEVVAFTGTPCHPILNGKGTPFEYAVKMKQFPSSARLDRVLERDGLHPTYMDQLAHDIATFHARIAIADPESPFGEPETIRQHAMDNFTILKQLIADNKKRSVIETLLQWSDVTFHRLRKLMEERKKAGYVRECHGDMHLGNMVLLQKRVVVFDCIEFNPSLNWIDVMNELAFLVMDLEQRGRTDLGFRFLNRELEYSGDYSGIVLLSYYLVYRAMVRAKVAGIRLSQTEPGSANREETERELQNYLSLAERYIRPQKNRLFITHGVSGSGKTHLTQPLLERLRAIRIRSDIERKRMFGLAPEARSGSTPGGGIYTPDATQRLYERLLTLAKEILRSGYPVVVDATFLKREQRERFRALAEQSGADFTILDFQADTATLRARIQRRNRERKDASEATLAVLERQLLEREPFGAEELPFVISIDTKKGDLPLKQLLP